MTDETEAVARGMAEFEGADWNAANYCETPNGEEPTEMRERFIEGAHVFITTLDRHRIERADRAMRDMVAIAIASQRPDGTDIPLGVQCREAAALIASLRAENARARQEGWNAAIEAAAGDVAAWFPDGTESTGPAFAIASAIRALAMPDPVRGTIADSDGDDGA